VRCIILAILRMKLPIEHAIERMTRLEGKLAHAEPINHPQTLTMPGLVSWSSPSIPSTAICGEKTKVLAQRRATRTRAEGRDSSNSRNSGTLEPGTTGTRKHPRCTPRSLTALPCHVILCGSYRTSPRPPDRTWKKPGSGKGHDRMSCRPIRSVRLFGPRI
jgi:hypothetical protein